MKHAFSPLGLSLLMVLGFALGFPAAMRADTVGMIATLQGKVYKDCEIVKVHPDGVSFTHRNGAAKVLFADLSSSWRQRLGYNAAKAEAYAKERAEKKERLAEAREKRDAELSKAMLIAQQMELTRLRLEEQRAAALVLGQQAAYDSAGWSFSAIPDAAYYGAASPIGAVFDGGRRDGVYRYRARSWTGNGLVSLGAGSGGVVAFPSGGTQFFYPGTVYSPTLGYYRPGYGYGYGVGYGRGRGYGYGRPYGYGGFGHGGPGGGHGHGPAVGPQGGPIFSATIGGK